MIERCYSEPSASKGNQEFCRPKSATIFALEYRVFEVDLRMGRAFADFRPKLQQWNGCRRGWTFSKAYQYSRATKTSVTSQMHLKVLQAEQTGTASKFM